MTTVTVLKRGAAYETARIKCLRRTSLARLSLVAATSDKFAAYRDQRLTEVASATVRKEMALFRHMFRLARQEWALPLASNPVGELKPPANGKPRNRRLSPAEVERVESAIERLRSPLMRALIRFALQTGMRRGELVKCEWHHLNEAIAQKLAAPA